MKRREFFKVSAQAGLALGIGTAGVSCEDSYIKGSAYSGKRLILIKLDGGNDGLFTCFPREHNIIDAARPGLSKQAKQNAIPIYGDWQLNYELKSLENYLGSGEIAILPFVGYPNPITSHFRATEIWDSAHLPGEVSGQSGWIGRMLDEGTLAIPGNDTPVISLSENETLLIKGEHKQGFTWLGNDLLHWYGEDVRHWLQHHKHSILASQLLREYNMLQELSNIIPRQGFPSTNLGNQLAKITSLVQQDKPFKVFFAMQGGYDTHTAAAGRLIDLYKDLNASLSALVSALKASLHWSETLVLVYSEFGRTVDENASGGTDHGAAGLCLLLGSNALIQKYAAITPEIRFIQMAGESYLAYQIDFRDLYADIRQKWLF